MVGLAWEQHVAFLDERPRAARIVAPVEQDAARLRRPPRSPLLRDRQRDSVLDRPLARRAARSSASSSGSHRRSRTSTPRRSSPTSTTRPPSTSSCRSSTSWLQRLPRARPDRSESYLARLHNIAGDRPLLITELGLDSRATGGDPGAPARAAAPRGVRLRLLPARSSSPGPTSGIGAGSTSTTGGSVSSTASGRPKPALAAVLACVRGRADRPRARRPRISVVVCTYNGEATIGACLEAPAASTTRTTR